MSTYTSGTGVGSGYANVHDTVDKVTNFFSYPGLIRSAVLVLPFILGVVNRKIWFGVDLIATTVAAAAWLLFPQSLLGFQVSRSLLDGVDLQLGRMVGSVLAGNAVLWFLQTKRTKDPDTIQPALLLTRVITNAVLMVAQIDIQLFSKAWSPEHMTFGLLGAALWTAGSLVHLVIGGYPGGHLQRYRNINNFLLRDFALCVVIGFTLYGFPRWFLRNFTLIRTLDGVHEHLTRAFGALIFGAGFAAYQAVGFLNDRDKEAHFIERLVTIGFLMASLIYAQFFYFKEWNMVYCWGVQFVLILWAIHSYLGLTSTERHYVPVTQTRRIVTDDRFSTRAVGEDRFATRTPTGTYRDRITARERIPAGDYEFDKEG
ncbi:uncharacterized protein LOC129593493 isoform X2 [Paramacrobiotus metropolitanus]|nr:uncharacterized protein LOC129593493 isoform X2 [Paramacrobiotus metropolitanus]